MVEVNLKRPQMFYFQNGWHNYFIEPTQKDCMVINDYDSFRVLISSSGTLRNNQVVSRHSTNPVLRAIRQIVYVII